MARASAVGVVAREKIASGIPGFDEVTQGGLPRGAVTIVVGGPGCGKTIFALQALAAGALAESRGSS